MRRRAWLFLLATYLFGAAGCGLHRAATPATLRVMSYNIHYGNPDLARIATVICESGADIVGLQEVDVHWSARSGFADQAAEIARRCGMLFRYGPIYTLPPLEEGKPARQFGVAVLSRLSIVSATNHSILRLSTQSESPAPAPMPGFLQATVDARGRTVDVFVTHLDYRPDPAVRAAQVLQMLDIMRNSTRPTILLGDMNAPPEAAELAPLFARLRDAWATGTGPGYTYPADAPVRRIDYVLVGGGPLNARAATVLATDASDHRPVIVELRLGSR